MAKKPMSKVHTGGSKEYTLLIRSVKSEKTGAYTFKEEILPNALVQETLKK